MVAGTWVKPLVGVSTVYLPVPPAYRSALSKAQIVELTKLSPAMVKMLACTTIQFLLNPSVG